MHNVYKMCYQLWKYRKTICELCHDISVDEVNALEKLQEMTEHHIPILRGRTGHAYCAWMIVLTDGISERDVPKTFPYITSRAMIVAKRHIFGRTLGRYIKSANKYIT